MAEGYLKHFANGKAEVFSAGIEAHGVNPMAVRAMKEDNIDISGNTSNNVEEFIATEFDFVITVCDNANESCPVFPGNSKKFHHNFPDPAKFTGNNSEVFAFFIEVRNSIREYSRNFIQQNF